MDFESMQLQAPVPGMSLTTEPKGRPWERPAQYSTPEEVLEFYVTQLSEPNRVRQVLGLLENGYPATSLVDSIILTGTMEGVHSLDVAIIVAPALFELITGMADSVDIKYENGITEKNPLADLSLVHRAMKMPEAQELAEELEEEDMAQIEEATSLMSKPVTLTDEDEE